MEKSQLWDLGKLLFAFCILTAYFIWSQFLVTWYGNLPEETGFFALRIRSENWAWLTWTSLIAGFAIPFFVLLGQKAKQSRVVLFIIATLVLAGMWLERYLLIVPSLAAVSGALIGLIEALVTVGFMVAMILSYRVYSTMILPRWFAVEA